MTLNPKCEMVETAQGVAVTVTGVAQVKVMTEPELLKTACEQFLGRSTRQIENIILQTLEGHLRAILGTLSVEEIYKGRQCKNTAKFQEPVGIPLLCKIRHQTQFQMSRLDPWAVESC